MTPKRRSRFFQSLHLLEQRLESESSQKKPCGSPTMSEGKTGNGLGLESTCKDSMLNPVISSENGDSSCPIFFSAKWNVEEADRSVGTCESNPPREFLLTPASSSMELSEKSQQEMDSENDGEGLNTLPLLCALLGLVWNKDTPLCAPMYGNDPPFAKKALEISTVGHEHPGSRFYINDTKVVERSSPQCIRTIDSWIAQLSKAQIEPYRLATLLIAKASLQNKEQLSNEKNLGLEFPDVVDQWLVMQHVSE